MSNTEKDGKYVDQLKLWIAIDRFVRACGGDPNTERRPIDKQLAAEEITLATKGKRQGIAF